MMHQKDLNYSRFPRYWWAPFFPLLVPSGSVSSAPTWTTLQRPCVRCVTWPDQNRPPCLWSWAPRPPSGGSPLCRSNPKSWLQMPATAADRCRWRRMAWSSFSSSGQAALCPISLLHLNFVYVCDLTSVLFVRKGRKKGLVRRRSAWAWG